MQTTSASALAYRARLNYRPARRAFSLAATDAEGLADVVRYCSAVWGGVTDVILIEQELGKLDGNAELLLASTDPDQIYVVGSDQHDRAAALRSQLNADFRAARELAYHDWAPPPGVRNQAKAIVPTEIWRAVVAGDPRPSRLSWPDAEMEPAAPAAKPPHELLRDTLTQSTWLDETTNRLVVDESDYGDNVPLTLVAQERPDDVAAFAYFWNIRALQRPLLLRVLLIPLWIAPEELTQLRADIARFIEGFWSWSEPEMLFVGRYLDDASIDERGTALGLVRYDGERITTHMGRPRPPGPLRYVRVVPSLPTRQRLRGERTEDYPFQVGTETRLRIDPQDAARGLAGSIALDLTGFSPLVMPPRPSLARLVHPNARVSREGIRWVGNFTARSELPIHIPTHAEIIRTLLRDVGLSFGVSSAGNAAERLLRFADGLDGVEVLRTDAALAVLKALAPEREKRILQQLKAIGQDPSEYRDVHVVVPRQSMSLADLASRSGSAAEALWPTVAELTQRRVVFAGFDIVCAHCGTEEWRAIDDVDQVLTCVGCREQIGLSASMRAGQREPQWSYTLNSAVAWPLEQDVLPVVFAVQTLVRHAKDASHFSIGVLTEGPNGPEVDAVITVDRDVFVVEGKTGANLTEDDVLKTTELATRLGGTAVFATLAEWSEESARLIAAVSDGKTPQVLSRKDLVLG